MIWVHIPGNHSGLWFEMGDRWDRLCAENLLFVGNIERCTWKGSQGLFIVCSRSSCVFVSRVVHIFSVKVQMTAAAMSRRLLCWWELTLIFSISKRTCSILYNSFALANAHAVQAIQHQTSTGHLKKPQHKASAQKMKDWKVTLGWFIIWEKKQCGQHEDPNLHYSLFSSCLIIVGEEQLAH